MTGGTDVRCEGVIHLYRTFDGHDVVALRGVDLTVRAGERVAFLGPSGCGKSTLLTLIGGIQRPTAGRIFLGEDEISALNERAVRRLRAGRVSTMLQGATRNLLPYATAIANLRFAAMARPEDERRDRADPRELLARVGLEQQTHDRVSGLSGGERQRLAIACALATSPELLLADEPTSALSHADRDEVVRLLHALGDQLGTTIIVVTHQPEVAESFPRTITMRDGRVAAEGRSGDEFAVIGEEGTLLLPGHLADLWPQGTLVRLESTDDDRIVVARDEAGQA